MEDVAKRKKVDGLLEFFRLLDGGLVEGQTSMGFERNAAESVLRRLDCEKSSAFEQDSELVRMTMTLRPG